MPEASRLPLAPVRTARLATGLLLSALVLPGLAQAADALRPVRQPAEAPAPPMALAAGSAQAAAPATRTAVEQEQGAKRATPYFISLRFDVAYFRTGPGKRYPITWVYHRRELPLRVERDFGNWSYVVDPSGQTGWVSQVALSNRRTFEVPPGAPTGTPVAVRAAPRDDAAAVATMEPGALGRLKRCEAGNEWCEVEVGQGIRGWLRRGEMWGLLPDEVLGG